MRRIFHFFLFGLYILFSQQTLANLPLKPFEKGDRVSCRSPEESNPSVQFQITVLQPISDRAEKSVYEIEGTAMVDGKTIHSFDSSKTFYGSYPAVLETGRIHLFINEADPQITYFQADFDPKTLHSETGFAMFYPTGGHMFNGILCDYLPLGDL